MYPIKPIAEPKRCKGGLIVMRFDKKQKLYYNIIRLALYRREC